MPLDPALFLDATYAIYLIGFLVALVFYWEKTRNPIALSGKVRCDSILRIDLLGVALLAGLFLILMLDNQAGDAAKQLAKATDASGGEVKVVALTPMIMVAGMISQAVPAMIVLVFLMVRGVKARDFFGLKWSDARLLWVIAPAGVIITFIFMFLLDFSGFNNWLIHAFGIEKTSQETVKIYQQTDAGMMRLLIAITVVVVAPLVEEVVFRGYIYTVTKRFTSRVVATLLTALLFGVVHNYLVGLIPLIFLAILLTLAYEKTGSLWAPISIHAVFNLSTILVQEAARYQ